MCNITNLSSYALQKVTKNNSDFIEQISHMLIQVFTFQFPLPMQGFVFRVVLCQAYPGLTGGFLLLRIFSVVCESPCLF